MSDAHDSSIVTIGPDGNLREIRASQIPRIVAYQNGTYQDCHFCHGKGCLACPGEARKAVENGWLDEQFSKPHPVAESMQGLGELCRPYLDAWQAEQDALPEHKKGRPRYDEESKVYRDCPLCDGEGCSQCPDEADKEYRRQFPNGIHSALICSIPLK